MTTIEPRAEWASMDARALADHIESVHHKYLHEELPRIGDLIAKIVSVHGERHPELTQIATCFDAIRADLEPHLKKEERVLFPLLRDPNPNLMLIERPIAMMAMEHDRVGDLFKQMRTLTSDYTVPADGCATYTATFAALDQLEADTHLHIHKENNVLFPMVLG